MERNDNKDLKPHLPNKEEEIQPKIPSNGNSPALNHQYTSAIHWPNPNSSSQSTPPLSFTQSYPSLWLPHQNPGYHLTGVNGFPLFQPFAVPGLCDPSSWWGQIQQSQPPLAYTFPGSYSQFPPQYPMIPRCSAPAEQSSQKGIIRPLAKLSQKHQQMWEAQSTENVQLWAVIGQLQSEIADYKSRVMKLEDEISYVKQTVKEPNYQVSGTVVSGKTSKKRGRPKRSTASLDESQLLNRKPREPIFEKVILKKAENNVKPVHVTDVTQQGHDKVRNVILSEGNGPKCSEINENNAVMPSIYNQSNKENHKDDAFTILAEQAKGMDHRTVLASFHAARDNGSMEWPYAAFPDMNAQRFYSDSSLIKVGEKVITGSGLANEEGASDELDDAMAAKAMDDEDEEMEEDGSSSGEEIAVSKGENLPQRFATWS